MSMRRLFSDERGTTVMEFAVIAPLFFALFLAIMDLSVGFFWIKSAEKASQLGVRLAVVRTPAALGLPLTNARIEPDGVFGAPCRDGHCAGFGTVECTGAGCDGAAFDDIFGRMQRLFGALEPEHVTIRYEDIGLGFAGGPVVPAVTVELRGVPWPLGFLGAVFALLNGDGGGLTTLPTIRATLTGEDLNTSGVGA